MSDIIGTSSDETLNGGSADEKSLAALEMTASTRGRATIRFTREPAMTPPMADPAMTG